MTAYELRIGDWSSDVCSSDLPDAPADRRLHLGVLQVQPCRREPRTCRRHVGVGLGEDRSRVVQLLRAGDIALAQLALAVGLLARPNLGGLRPPHGCLGAFDLYAERCGVDTNENVACLADAALFEQRHEQE